MASLTQTIAYGYNASGQLTTVTTPSGRSVVYGYSNNRPVSITVDGSTLLSSVIHEPFGPIGGWSWGNSTQGAPNTHTRLFDKDFRTTRVTSDLPASGGQPAFDRQFAWDDASRIGSITDLANSALSASYGYDSLDRLSSASQGTSAWGYTYSGVGDRLTSTVNSATTNYGYSSGTHRLASLSGAQSKSYTFDAAGNMTSDGTTTWTYGGNNRPTAAGSTAFLINALGQRVKKTTGSTAVRFVYDEAGRLWGEYDSSGTLIQETVWLEDLPVATIRPNGSNFDLFYVHADQLGTPRKVTRPSDNAIMWRWDNTEAFGDSAPIDNPSGLETFAFNLRFPGQYFDAETGKHYNYFREYDPAIGRYIESDPIGLKGGLNTYAYVKSAPLNFIDRWGLLIIKGSCAPDQRKRLEDAERQIQKKLDQSCMPCGGPEGCIPCHRWEPLRRALQTSEVDCSAGDVCGRGQVGGRRMWIMPLGFNSPSQCGPLASTVLHELGHNIGIGESGHPEIYDLEKSCFGSPVPPTN